MRRLLGALAIAAVAFPAASVAAAVEPSAFRYTRTLDTDIEGYVVFEPDGPMFEHARDGFADLRVVDADGEQVPWRILPRRERSRGELVLPLNAGRRGNAAVALFDLGPKRRVRDRMMLVVPDRNFVGRATVLGADDRNGPFTRLSTTGIYDITGAQNARSTTAVFPPTDFRYLSVEATGVTRIESAVVSGAPNRAPLVERQAFIVSRRDPDRGRRTVITYDFHNRDIPIVQLRIAGTARRYDRLVHIEGSNDGKRFVGPVDHRISRFPGSQPAPFPFSSTYRYLRLTIENGDDEPLDILLEAWSQSMPIVLERGHTPPFRVLYGGRGVPPASYEFARIPLPRGAATVRGTLGPERRNAAFEPPADTRSFAAKHPEAVQIALALAAVVLGAVGLLALRRRA